MARFDYEGFAHHLLDDPELHRSGAGTVYGSISGAPIHVGVGNDQNGGAFLAVVVGSVSEEASQRIKDAWVEADDQLRKGQVEVQPVGALAKIPVGKAAKAGYDTLEARVREMARIAASIPNATPDRAPGARPALVNDVPMFLTESEAGEIRLETSQAAAEYHEFEPRLARGLLFGLVGVVVAAVVWAVLAVFANWSGWIVAIGAGLLIGYLALRGAEKTSRALQVMIGVLALIAVFAGDWLGLTIFGVREFGVLDPGAALEVYFAVLGDDTSVLFFTFGAGLVGAWFGSRMGKIPDVETLVELAPV